MLLLYLHSTFSPKCHKLRGARGAPCTAGRHGLCSQPGSDNKHEVFTEPSLLSRNRPTEPRQQPPVGARGALWGGGPCACAAPARPLARWLRRVFHYSREGPSRSSSAETSQTSRWPPHRVRRGLKSPLINPFICCTRHSRRKRY